MEKKEIKIFMSPANLSTHIAKMPENFRKIDELPKINPQQLLITHTKKKDNTFFQIEDKNKIQPEYYEGTKEESSQKGSCYLALAYNKMKNEVRVLPVKHWILFHKNVKYMDEEEYNLKVQMAEAEFVKMQKGSRGYKKLLKKKEEDEEFEKENQEKKNLSGSEKNVVLGKRKREEENYVSPKESAHNSEDDEAEFFENFTQNNQLPLLASKTAKKEKETGKFDLYNLNFTNINNSNNNNNNNNNQNEFLKSKNEDSDVPGSRTVTSDAKKDESFDDEFPELKQNN